SRVTETTEEIATLILPANDALRDLAFALEERVVASRSRFLTGDPRYDVRVAEAKVAEDAALQTLAELAPRLGVSMTRQQESLERLMARRDSIEASIVRGGE